MTNGFLEVKAIKEDKKKSVILIASAEDKVLHYEIVSVLEGDTVFKPGQNVYLDHYALQQLDTRLFIKREAVYGIID